MNDKIIIELDAGVLRSIIREELQKYFGNSNHSNETLINKSQNLSIDMKKTMSKMGFDVIGSQYVELGGKKYLPSNLLTRSEALDFLGISNGTFAKLKRKYNINPVENDYKHYYDKEKLIDIKQKLKIWKKRE